MCYGVRPACAPARAPACAPATRTITVNCTEWVQETKQVPCTTYTWQQKVENYTAYRRETTTECRPYTYVCKHYVTEQVMETRNCVERVPYWEDRVVTKTHYVTQQVTEMREKVVSHGHWETKEVPAFSVSLFGHHGCCDCCCPKTKCVRCWVACKETVCCPVTCCKRVPVCEQCTVKVCCYKTVCKQIQVPCCKTRCVCETKTEMRNVCVTHCVPYQCSRTVCCCVPVCTMKTVTCCVPHCVQKQIQVSCCAPTSCGCCR